MGSEMCIRDRRRHVVIIGIGALGSTLAMLSVRSGIGRLTLVDRDFVEAPNLQDQCLYEERDIGEAKAVAAAEHLQRINSQAEIVPVVEDFNPRNAERIIEGADLCLDGTDNFETRYVLNDAAVKHHTPWVYMGALRTYGAVMPIIPEKTACLECIYPHAPPPGTLPTCESVGVLSSLPNTVASMGFTLGLKILLSQNVPKRLIAMNLWEGTFETVDIKSRRRGCECCERRSFNHLKYEGGQAVVSLCGRNAFQILPSKAEIDLNTLCEKLRKIGSVKVGKHLLRAHISGAEITLFPDGRAIIKGASSAERAKSIYSRYIGN